MSTTEYVRSIEPFATWDGGVPRHVHLGDVITKDDPVYRGREHLFETMDEHAAREASFASIQGRSPVERTTAAPGEARPVHIPDPEPEDGDETLLRCPEPDCEFTSSSTRGLNIHQRVHNPTT